MAEYKTTDQVNYGWGLTLNMTGKAPAVAKRIFQTYNDALAYIQDDNDSAIAGLRLSVIADSDNTKNGIYFVKSIGANGQLEKAGSGSGDLTNYYTKSETQNYVTSRIEDSTQNQSHDNTWTSYAITDYVSNSILSKTLQYLKDGSGNGSIVSKSSLVTNEATGNSSISLGRGQSVRANGAVGLGGTSGYVYVNKTSSETQYRMKLISGTPPSGWTMGNANSLANYFGYAAQAMVGARLWSTAQKLYGRIATASIGSNIYEVAFTVDTTDAEVAFPSTASSLRCIIETIQIAGGTYPAVAMGDVNMAYGGANFSIGRYNYLYSGSNFVIGEGNASYNTINFIFGEGNKIDYRTSQLTGNAIFGYTNNLTGQLNGVIGYSNNISTNNNIVVGENLNSGTANSVVLLGKYNDYNYTVTPSLVFGSGTSETNRRNALVVDTNNNIYMPEPNKVSFGSDTLQTLLDGAGGGSTEFKGSVFDGFANCEPVYTKSYTITSANPRRLFVFENSADALATQTGWCEGTIFITDDNGTIDGKYSFLVKLNGNICAYLQTQDLGTTASTRGLYNFILRTPSAPDNGSEWMVDIVCTGANTTNRNITLNIMSMSSNCTIVANDDNVTSDNTSSTTLAIVRNSLYYANAGGTIEAVVSSATAAGYVTNRENKYVNVPLPTTAVRIESGSLSFNSSEDNKYYPCTETGKAIDLDSGIGAITATTSANIGVNAIYYSNKCGITLRLNGLTYPATWTLGPNVYLKCTYPDASGNIYSTAELVTTKSPGYTYICLGKMTTTVGRIALSTDGQHFMSIDANGKLTHINGMELA